MSLPEEDPSSVHPTLAMIARPSSTTRNTSSNCWLEPRKRRTQWHFDPLTHVFLSTRPQSRRNTTPDSYQPGRSMGKERIHERGERPRRERERETVKRVKRSQEQVIDANGETNHMQVGWRKSHNISNLLPILFVRHTNAVSKQNKHTERKNSVQLRLKLHVLHNKLLHNQKDKRT